VILIAGIGNIFLGDDAFGCEVVRRLERRCQSPGVRVRDFGIRGMDLVYELMNGYDAAIIVDAMPVGEPPGTIYVMEPELSEIEDAAAAIDAHSMDPMRVLALARTMGATLKNIRIVGCEPETFGPADEGQMGLSPAVAAAVEQGIEAIESLLTEMGTKETAV
jgi:hydrogenase maturation protease